MAGMKVQSIQDLVDVLQSVQRDWGNDSNINVVGVGRVIESFVTKDGTVWLKTDK